MRKDGKRVKNVDPMYTLAPYFMRDRHDAQNMITELIPYDPIHDYVVESRKNGVRISHLAVVIAAFVRVVSQFKSLNRFVVNSKIYARNSLSLGMVVLRPGEADPSMSKMNFDLYDTIFDVNDKVTSFVEANNKETSNNSSDDLFKNLVSMSFLVRAVMALLRWLDKHGMLPKMITDLSPFHNTAVITNLASIRTNYIYHHVYTFGTTGMILAMGNNVDTPFRNSEGNVDLRKDMPIGIVMDERIASGCYYARVFAKFKQYMQNPKLLETPPESVDVDFEFEGLSKRFAKPEKSKKSKK